MNAHRLGIKTVVTQEEKHMKGDSSAYIVSRRAPVAARANDTRPVAQTRVAGMFA